MHVCACVSLQTGMVLVSDSESLDELLNDSINTEKCNGCTLCAKKCPSEAILGAKKSPHYIVPDKCIRCGACVDACRFGAVTAA